MTTEEISKAKDWIYKEFGASFSRVSLNAGELSQLLESYAKQHAEPILKLLELAKCPACDGSGAIGRFTLDGNGDPDVEWEQCQWCDERKQLLDT